jgi:hypothetical protein
MKSNWPHEPAYVSDLRHLALQYKTERQRPWPPGDGDREAVHKSAR